MNSRTKITADGFRSPLRTAWGAAAVLCLAASAHAIQFARPDATVSAGAWTAQSAPTLHEATDEISPNGDTDYIAATSSTTAELGLSDVTDPGVSTGHIMRYSYKSTGGGSPERCTLELYQGGTLIADAGNTSSRGAYSTFDYTLTILETDAITDYTDLRFRIVSSLGNNESIWATWAELEVPDAAAATPPTLSSPTAPFANIDTTSALLGATVDTDGGSPVLERGTVWNITGPPIIELPLAAGGTTLDAFSHTRSSLPAGTLIYFRGYATNVVGFGYSPDAQFYTEPTAATGVGFEAIGTTSFRVTWTDTSTGSSLVLMKQGSPVDFVPVDGTAYTPNATFGAGTELATGNYAVFGGAGTQVDVDGLTPGQDYYVAVYALAGSGAEINYQQDGPATGTQTTDAGGGLPVLTSPTTTAIDLTTATLGATVDSDGGSPILTRGTVWNETGAPVTENLLVEGTAATGTFSHARSGLSSGTHIYFRGWASNSTGIAYSPDGDFFTEPTQAANVTLSSVTHNSLTVNWNAGGGDGALVIMKEGSAVTASPTDGIEHTASSSFGSGADLGGSEFVVFRGAGTSAPVSGLSPLTDYHVAVFEYAGTGTLINYQQDGAPTDSTTTLDTPVAVGHNAIHGVQCNQCHAHGLNTTYVPRDDDVEARCKSCHNPSGPASTATNVANHIVVVDSVTNVVDCGSCHEVHNGSGDTLDRTSYSVRTDTTDLNLSFVRSDMNKYVATGLTNTVFQQRPVDFAFTNAAPWEGVCQSCHTIASNHRNDGTGDQLHEGGSDCMTCHGHLGGFQPEGGGGCVGCHSSVRGPRRAIVGEFTLTSHHVLGGAVTDDDCAVCHDEVNSGSHKNGVVDLRDPDNAANLITFTDFSRNTASETLESWVTDVQNNFCLHCHDADGASDSSVWAPGATSGLQPFSSNTRDAPDIFTKMDPANPSHHAVRAAGNNTSCIPSALNGSVITMEPPWNQDATHDQISCFDCHATSGHGDANQRMVLDPIDFDDMLTATVKADIALTVGAAVETFCVRCHKATIYLGSGSGSKMEKHGGDQGQHGNAGGNTAGCMGCHGGIVNLGEEPKGGGPRHDNGATPGAMHGSDFDWSTTTSFATGPTDSFLFGGFIGGWGINGTDGECTGGDCNHSSDSRASQSYSQDSTD